MSNQGLRQKSARTIYGGSADVPYNEDFMRMFTAEGVPTAGAFDGRFLQWLNIRLARTYTNLPEAMTAFAVSQGVANWDSVGTFAAFATPPVNTVAPVISGTPTAGQTLTSTTGTWTGTAPITYAYQWKRGVTNVGTNASTYVLVTGDIGADITCVVTATNAAGSADATSNSLGPVADVYAGADIVLDFAGVKNGGTPLYRRAGTTYATAALAGFVGTGTFDASGYTATGVQKITGAVTFPAAYVVYAQFDQPATDINRAAFFENTGSGPVLQRLTTGEYYFAGSGPDAVSATKFAGGFNGNRKVSVNGGAVVTGGAAPAAAGVTTLHIGNSTGNTQPWAVPIKLIQIFLSAQTDAQILAMAT